jgi:hypothetical protein
VDVRCRERWAFVLPAEAVEADVVADLVLLLVDAYDKNSQYLITW